MTPTQNHAGIHIDPIADLQGQIENLKIALDSNRRISMAIGILIERFRLTDQAGFDILREFSSSTNRKLRDVADTLVATGHLDGIPDHGDYKPLRTPTHALRSVPSSSEAEQHDLRQAQ